MWRWGTAVAMGVAAACAPLGEEATVSPHAFVGLPAVQSKAEVLIEKPQYVLSYDTDARMARWVAWRLASADLGTVKRCDCWAPDAALPVSLQPKTEDFGQRGYEVGHLCPAQDRSARAEDNRETFRAINAVPQTHALNTGPWEDLELAMRQLVRNGRVLYVIAGPLPSDAVVPAAYFKVVLAVPSGSTDAAQVGLDAEVIAGIFPNTTRQLRDYRDYLVAVREVEQATGLLFFTNISPQVRAVLEVREP